MKAATRLLTALSVAAVVLATTACSPAQEASVSSSATASAGGVATTAAPSTAVELGEVDETDPDSVADAVAVALSVHDARTDATSQAVWARAQPLLTGDLADSAPSNASRELERPDSRWVMMQNHQAYDVVENIDRSTDDPIPDTPERAQRQRAVRVRAYGDDGWNGLPRTTRYWLIMTTVDGVWRVTSVHATID